MFAPIPRPSSCEHHDAVRGHAPWESLDVERKRLLEHSIIICGSFDKRLTHIPVLDDLPVVEPENIHDCQSEFAGLPLGMNVKDHEIAFCEDALDLAPQVGKLLFEILQERSEAVDAVLDLGLC